MIRDHTGNLVVHRGRKKERVCPAPSCQAFPHTSHEGTFPKHITSKSIAISSFQGGRYMTDHTSSPSESQGYEGYALDAENAAEMARLMVQDRVLTAAMGGVLPEQTTLTGVH